MMLQGYGSLAILGPTTAVLLGWTAGAAFGLNPFGDEGAVLPTTLTAVSGRAFVRGLIVPSLLFTPVITVVTLGMALVGGYGLLAAIALALIGCFLTVVGATLAPIIGMWLPRYSAIRIGNSDGVRPPRLLAGVLHVVSMLLPGAALVGLVAAPELVRLALSGIGYVPGFILGLVANGGVLTTLALSLTDAGATIRGLRSLPSGADSACCWLSVGYWSPGTPITGRYEGSRPTNCTDSTRQHECYHRRDIEGGHLVVGRPCVVVVRVECEIRQRE